MKDTQLKYALAAWKELSFTGAAEKLNISQSAISQQISLLEREIGFTIFDRVGNGIKPSYKGGLFLIQADQALSGINNLSNIVILPGFHNACRVSHIYQAKTRLYTSYLFDHYFFEGRRGPNRDDPRKGAPAVWT